MKNKMDEITRLLWKVPKMNVEIVQGVIKILDTDVRVNEMLRCLKENEESLPKTIPDEIIKITLQIIDLNR